MMTTLEVTRAEATEILDQAANLSQEDFVEWCKQQSKDHQKRIKAIGMVVRQHGILNLIGLGIEAGDDVPDVVTIHFEEE